MPAQAGGAIEADPRSIAAGVWTGANVSSRERISKGRCALCVERYLGVEAREVAGGAGARIFARATWGNLRPYLVARAWRAHMTTFPEPTTHLLTFPDPRSAPGRAQFPHIGGRPIVTRLAQTRPRKPCRTPASSYALLPRHRRIALDDDHDQVLRLGIARERRRPTLSLSLPTRSTPTRTPGHSHSTTAPARRRLRSAARTTSVHAVRSYASSPTSAPP
jgi:hypothetical protein